MKRCLGPLDLVSFGVGIMLGAGVFVTTGVVAVQYTGPAIVIAYAVAGLSALLSSLCYAEFSVNVPQAGGAYNYVLMSCGEFLAWFTVANLTFEYVLANAGCIRGFSPYFASLINKPSDFFIILWNGYQLDFWAFGVVLALTCLLIFGMQESAWFNLIITILHIGVVVLIIIVGFTAAETSNFTPFAPFGWRGIFTGASVVFFSYIGFDAVATTAEEAKNVARDMPIGIIGSMLIVTLLYLLMAAVLVLMVPTSMIDEAAPFTQAFAYHNIKWMQYIVALGALMGIVTSTMVGILGGARILTSAARNFLVPPVFSIISEKTHTPWVATLTLGVITAIISLFTAFDSLVNLVSICTLFVFWLVAVALIWQRQYQSDVSTLWQTAISALFLAALMLCSMGFVIYWNIAPESEFSGLIVFGVLALVVSVCFYIWTKFVPPAFTPATFKIPMYPLLPCASVFLNTFLLGTLHASDYINFAIWISVCFGFYILYSLHGSAMKDILNAKPATAPILSAFMPSTTVPRRASWVAEIRRQSQISSAASRTGASISMATLSTSAPLEGDDDPGYTALGGPGGSGSVVVRKKRPGSMVAP